MRKYGNRKTTVGGIVFDSMHEARRYRELSLLQRAGKISELELQKEYELVPAQYETFPRYGKKGQRIKDGKRLIEKPVKYIADFAYKVGNLYIVEDAKGVRTKDYVVKRKLMLYVHGIKIKEV